MKKPLAAALASLFLSLPATAAESGPQPPQLKLGDAAAPKAYDLRLAIDPRQDRFSGEVRITMHVSRDVPVLWLNAEALDIDEATFETGGKAAKARTLAAAHDFVGFAVDGGFHAGDYVATIRFRGPIEPLDTRGLFRQREGGEWYAVTQFESISARRAFPCFDEPHWKTPWRVTIDAPAADKAVSNAPEESVGDVPGKAGWKRHVFATTKPLTTYLVAYAVGPFDIVEGAPGGEKRTPLRYLAPKGRGADARFARESTPQLLGVLERYFGIPYPYEKLDSVPIPATVGFGAMENAGMITYASNLLLARPSRESLAFQRAYASVGAHEMAHQWFGDLVTMAWWDDTWLNEGFASWMARKTVATWKPEWDSGWRSGEGRRRAINSDRLMSARRVANPVEAKNDIYNAFDGITYSKGAEVLSMFESWLGPESFRKGVRNYLEAHAWGNATSADFFRAVGDASGRGDVAVAAFRSFIEQPGLPLVEAKMRCEGDRATLDVSPHRFIPKGTKGDEIQWMLPACFTYGIGNEVGRQCAEVPGPRSIALEKAPHCPDWVVGNADGAGHWVARWDAPAQQRIVANAARLPEREAVALAANVELMMKSGLMPVGDALRTADALFAHASLGVQHAAYHVVEEAEDADLAGDDAALRSRLVAQRVIPLAERLGWLPRDGENLEVQEFREALMPFAVRQPEGERLRAPARKLAMQWLERPDSLPGSAVAAVLRAAASFADRPTFDALVAALPRVRDQRDRVDLLGALATVRDPALRDASFKLLLARGEGGDVMNGRDANTYLEKALDDYHNRSAAFDFVRAHWPALDAKLPHEIEGRLMREMNGLCTAHDRDAFRQFWSGKADAIQGGPRSYAQALEGISICVASMKRG